MRLSLLCVVLLFFLDCILSGQEVTHGPIVGGVTDNSAVFVLRTDSTAWVQAELSRSINFTNPIFSTVFNTANDSDNFGKVEVTGLQADSRYYYRAVVNEVPVTDDLERSFHTFPEPGSATTFEFHFGSGQQNGPDPQSGFGTLFPKMATDEPDFFIHQGDWGYPDTTDVESGMPENYFPLDYRNVIATYHARYDPNFPMAELMAITPVAYTYDDHDMIDNNSDGYLFPWEGIANTIKGYQNMFPGYPLVDASKGIWHKFTYGNTDIFMVDNRAQRTPNLANFDIYAPNNVVFNPKPGEYTFLGADQMNWLLTELSNSTATWKFISSGTPFNPSWRVAIELAVLTQGIIDSVGVPGEGYITPTEIAVELSDKWAGFPNDIIQIIQHVRENNIENVIFLSGDTHTSGIDDGIHSIFPELMAGGLDRTNGQLQPLFETFGIKIWNKGGHTVGLPPEEYGNAYGRVTVFGEDSVALEAISESGLVLGRHIVEPGFIPKEAGAAVAPLIGLDYGEVEIGQIGAQGVIVVSTSVNPLQITNLTLSGDFNFFLDPTGPKAPFEIPAGSDTLVGIGFLATPPAGDTSQALLQFETNDPDQPVFMIPMQAVAITPGAITTSDEVPYKYALEQNYPNPFNPSTTIEYSLPKTEQVTIELYTITGQKVRTLLDAKMPAGRHDLQFSGTDLASGVYFYRIQAGAFTQVRKMMLLK